LHHAPLRLQPVPDARHGAAGDFSGRHLSLDRAILLPDGAVADRYHDFSADRIVAAFRGERQVNGQWRAMSQLEEGNKKKKANFSHINVRACPRTTDEEENGTMTGQNHVTKRDFLRKAGLTTAGAVGASTLAAPYVKAQSPITWRMQTYAGPALAEHVIKNSIDWFNKAANGEMVIELYTSDQLVPQGELFRAVQAGTIDAAQSDDDSAAAPVDVKVFGAYFPLASRY